MQCFYFPRAEAWRRELHLHHHVHLLIQQNMEMFCCFSLFFVICSTHFTFSFFFSSSSSPALNAATEELFFFFFPKKKGTFLPWETFFGGLWHNWSGRVKVWELKWSYFMNSVSFRWHAGWRYAATLAERNTKTPLRRASWLILFCCAPMKEIHPAAKLLTWNECFYRRGKKTCLALWLRLKFYSSKVWIIQDQGAGWVTSRCVLNGAICLKTTVQSEAGSYVRPGYMFLLSELWATRQQDGWDAIRTFFCLQPVCVPSFLVFPAAYWSGLFEASL